MKPENKAILDENRCHYETATRAGFVKGFNSKEKDDLLRVMREEFMPGYTTDLWCGPCIFDFIKLIYQLYDKWLEEQPKPIENIKATFPAQDKPQANEQDTFGNTQQQSNTPNGNHSPRRYFRKGK